ncbi:MAG: hypothetical protein NXH82_14015 [Rhodobacteraceae bacterium]|nr:hypothetical protein [Paracoccaceae bacterium]
MDDVVAEVVAQPGDGTPFEQLLLRDAELHIAALGLLEPVPVGSQDEFAHRSMARCPSGIPGPLDSPLFEVLAPVPLVEILKFSSESLDHHRLDLSPGFFRPGFGADQAAGLRLVPVDGLCCTKPLGDSPRESSVIAGWHEQTDTPDLQDQELAGL